MKSKELLAISIGIFLTILMWLIADLIHVRRSTALEDIVVEKEIPDYAISSSVFSTLNQKIP